MLPDHLRCGVIHGKEPSCEDTEGCVLAAEHDGPHEFVATNGEVWQWETDMACDCDWCRTADGDWCTTYWRKRDLGGEAEFQSWLAVLRTRGVTLPETQQENDRG